MDKTDKDLLLGSVNEEIQKKNHNDQVVIIEFSLGENFYGIDMELVQEVIRAPESFIQVPEVHSAIEGVIRLRENIIPVVNLNKYLQLNNSYEQNDSRIIIAQRKEELCGFWVNKVNQIHHLDQEHLEEPPELVASGKGYVRGVVKFDQEVVFVLDFQRICDDLIMQEGFHQIPMHVPVEAAAENDAATEKAININIEEVNQKKN